MTPHLAIRRFFPAFLAHLHPMIQVHAYDIIADK